MPPTAEQAAQAQTQAHTTVTQAPAGGRPDARAQGDLAQPTDKPAEQPANESPESALKPGEPAASPPGFGERGRMRRRARFLRKARELAYRDLGGLVYDLHRFGQRNDQVVLAKLATLGHIDAELRALEDALHEIKPVTVLREVGIAACPRCAAIHGNEDRFCPGCGLAFDAGADRPLSTAPVTATPQGDTSTPAAEPPRPAVVPATPAPAPVLKPTAPAVAARPQTATEGNGKAEPEDEPTQILRPPSGGA